ncbi:unnamed protein product [Spirodela intermedia]|uniref:Uncharacterized protein n=1 Tax=Spirodela intermedia TaxID=51605 RepID=A0A7I8IW85_SPIIN|nr:unnamed protein product [Spirodela intermedia]CAA6662070.1 unnamed protein product [Spirodela intermedia]
MNSRDNDDDGEEGGEVFLDEDDILEEIPFDEEDLPDVDDDIGSDGDAEEPDDSVHVFTGHTDEVYAVMCSPTDPAMVATGGRDDKGFLWKIGRADWGSELQGHTDSVSALAFSADGQLLSSGGLDGLIQVWDATSGNRRCVLEGPGKGIEWVRWHPRGHLVLAGSEDSTLWMWNADKNSYLNVFSGHGDTNLHVVAGHPYHTEGLTCLAITADSAVAITGSKDGVINSLMSHTDSVECIGLSSSHPWLATAGMDQKLLIWDLQRSSQRCSCDHEEGVTCLSWLGASHFVATGSVDGKIRVWDGLSGNCVKIFHGHTDVIQSLSVSADGEHLVSASLDRTARVFEISEFR